MVIGLNVAAVDIDDAKLALARRLGAAVTVNAKGTDSAAAIRRQIGGAHGVLVTAASPKAFEQTLGFFRRGGNGLGDRSAAGQFSAVDLRCCS